MGIKVYLDDVREAPDGWVLAKTVNDVFHYLENNNVEEISLDFDLGENTLTGNCVLNYLERLIRKGELKNIPIIHIHSMNPVGRKIIQDKLKEIKKYLEGDIDERN